MPAHLWDRAGEFRAGEEANRLSVAAGDREGDDWLRFEMGKQFVHISTGAPEKACTWLREVY